MKAFDLRIPGPTPIPPQVMQAMQRMMIPHRGAEFRAFHRSLIDKLQAIHQTDGDVFVMPGSGSIGWEAAIVNTLSPGDTVVSFVTGDFGKRFAAVAEAFHLDVVRVEVTPGSAAKAHLVRETLESYPDAKAVLYTWNETSTGVTNPVAEIAPIVNDHGALLFVDAVSAAGALPLEMDAWGLDVVLSGSQKAWMCPPGLAIVAVSERAQRAEASASFPRAFIDFRKWRSSVAKGDTPATSPLSLYYGLDVACDMILKEGIQARAKRHADAGRLTRDRFAKAGLALFAEPDVASDTVTAAVPPKGMTASELVAAVRKQSGIDIAAGQGDLADEIIRVGHMGWFELAHIERAVDAVITAACSK